MYFDVVAMVIAGEYPMDSFGAYGQVEEDEPHRSPGFPSPRSQNVPSDQPDSTVSLQRRSWR
jgi:hypothetical protein